MEVPASKPRAGEARERSGLLVLDEAVRGEDLSAVRGRVQRVAAAGGLDADAEYGFVFAVNEAMINALEHGGGPARVRVWRDGQIICEVRDHGPGLRAADAAQHQPAEASTAARPAPDQPRGRGLWLARQVADGFSVTSGGRGTAVRVVARRPGAGDAPDPDGGAPPSRT